jgi:hypothetical protein
MPAVYKLSEAGTAALAIRTAKLALDGVNVLIKSGVDGSAANSDVLATYTAAVAAHAAIVESIAVAGAVAEV